MIIQDDDSERSSYVKYYPSARTCVSTRVLEREIGEATLKARLSGRRIEEINEAARFFAISPPSDPAVEGVGGIMVGVTSSKRVPRRSFAR